MTSLNRREMKKERKPHRILESGERYGRWTVLEYAGVRKASASSTHRLRVYRCVCDCGREREVRGTDLVRGVSLSCGCVRWETRKANAAAPRRRRVPRPYVPEHPERFTDDWMFEDVQCKTSGRWRTRR